MKAIGKEKPKFNTGEFFKRYSLGDQKEEKPPRKITASFKGKPPSNELENSH